MMEAFYLCEILYFFISVMFFMSCERCCVFFNVLLKSPLWKVCTQKCILSNLRRLKIVFCC